ncbi:unnamed protein product [Diamesa serratosioi]
MFYIIGLGLGGPKDITVKGLEVIRNCDSVFMDSYTSALSCGKEALLNAVGCCGLNLYQFGEAITIPYWNDISKPDSFYDTIKANRARGLHTLCLLDIREPTEELLNKKEIEFDPTRFMSVCEASDQLLQIVKNKRAAGVDDSDLAFNEETLVVGVARVGHESQAIIACSLIEMHSHNLGKPLHSMIIPAAKLQVLETDYFQQFCSEKL